MQPSGRTSDAKKETLLPGGAARWSAEPEEGTMPKATAVEQSGCCFAVPPHPTLTAIRHKSGKKDRHEVQRGR